MTLGPKDLSPYKVLGAFVICCADLNIELLTSKILVVTETGTLPA